MKTTFLILIAFLSLTSCSSDDDNMESIEQPHIVEFTTGTLVGSVTVTLSTTIQFEDGTEFVVNSNFDYDNYNVSVDIPVNAVSFVLDYYIEDSSESEMRFYGATNGNVIHQETINQLEYIYEYSF